MEYLSHHQQSTGGAILIRAALSPGLYRFTIDADGGRFDWESLNLKLNEFGNVHAETGPWDFDLLHDNRPLLPAYWVWLNDRKLGLMYFNRPSADQVARRWFRGEVGFRIRERGEYTLKFEPYHPFEITWRTTVLEPEPQDTWEPPPERDNIYARRILPDVMPNNSFTEGFLQSVEWAKSKPNFNTSVSGFELPILVAAWVWSRDRAALRVAERAIAHYLALPAWGNPRADGYGHNGDMMAAKILFGLSVVLRWLPEELRHLRDPLVRKLTDQGDVFLEQTLFHRGYWGGAVLQDHGFQSAAWFATAGYFCQGLIPSAREWLAFSIPRMHRTLRALPKDGIVPCTSYHTLSVYVDKLVVFRELHREATGEDIYAQDGIRSIASSARALWVAEDESRPTPRGDPHGALPALAYPCPLGDLWPYEGAFGFVNQLADRDADAAWLLETILSSPRLFDERYPYYEGHFQKNWLWALLFHQPTISPAVQSEALRPAAWFRDSGVVAIRCGSSLAVAKCGYPTSQTSYQNARHNHDRLCFAPLAGNFVFIHASRKIFHCTDSRYRILTAHGNVLLVDGAGQRGDLGMPMSQPDAPYYGERIVEVTERRAQMDLTPAYEGLQRYMRCLELGPDGSLLLRDVVSARRPCRFTWLFHTYQRNPWRRLGERRWELCVEGRRYRVEFDTDDGEWTSRIDETAAVWSYPQNDRERCHHLAVETVGRVAEASLRLVVEPEDQEPRTRSP